MSIQKTSLSLISSQKPSLKILLFSSRSQQVALYGIYLIATAFSCHMQQVKLSKPASSFTWMEWGSALFPVLLSAIASYWMGPLGKVVSLICAIGAKYIMDRSTSAPCFPSLKARPLVLNALHSTSKRLNYEVTNRKALMGVITDSFHEFESCGIDTTLCDKVLEFIKEESAFGAYPKTAVDQFVCTLETLSQMPSNGRLPHAKIKGYLGEIALLQKKCGLVCKAENTRKAAEGIKNCKQEELREIIYRKDSTRLKLIEELAVSDSGRALEEVDKIETPEYKLRALRTILLSAFDRGVLLQCAKIFDKAGGSSGYFNRIVLEFLESMTRSAQVRVAFKRHIKIELEKFMQKDTYSTVVHCDLCVYILTQLGEKLKRGRDIFLSNKNRFGAHSYNYRLVAISLLSSELELRNGNIENSIKYYKKAKNNFNFHYVYFNNRSHLITLVKIAGLLYSTHESKLLLNRDSDSDITRYDKLECWLFLLEHINNSIRTLSAMHAIEKMIPSFPLSLTIAIEGYLNRFSIEDRNHVFSSFSASKGSGD